MICNELDAENAEQTEKKEIQMKFFLLKGETNMHDTNAKTHRRTQENFIQRWWATESPMLEYIDLGVK